MAFPYQGRAIPFHFITYSSRTIQKESTSRNREHFRVIEGLKGMIGDKPLVMDREFSYEGLFEYLAGEWGKGFREPLWIISTIEPEEALEIYKARMKIEQSFKDLKILLHLDKIMNKNRETMEKMVAMMLIAYAIGLLLGESIRQRVYQGKKFNCYSGLFILLRQHVFLSKESLIQINNQVNCLFTEMVPGNVPTFV